MMTRPANLVRFARTLAEPSPSTAKELAAPDEDGDNEFLPGDQPGDLVCYCSKGDGIDYTEFKLGVTVWSLETSDDKPCDELLAICRLLGTGIYSA